jgi:hypothetical protein
VVERAAADRIAAVRQLGHLVERGLGQQLGVEPHHVGVRDHHVARLAAREVEHVVQELLLRARDDAGALGLVDQRLQLGRAPDPLAGDHVLHAERPQQERRGDLEHPHDRAQDAGDHLDRRRHDGGQPLGPVEGQGLRDELAEDHGEVGHGAERDHEAEPGGHAVAEDVAHDRLADGTGEDPDRRDADLHGRDHAHGVVHQAQRGLRALAAALGQRRDGAAPSGHHRVLADHEERVARHQCQHREDAERVAHPP